MRPQVLPISCLCGLMAGATAVAIVPSGKATERGGCIAVAGRVSQPPQGPCLTVPRSPVLPPAGEDARNGVVAAFPPAQRPATGRMSTPIGHGGCDDKAPEVDRLGARQADDLEDAGTLDDARTGKADSSTAGRGVQRDSRPAGRQVAMLVTAYCPCEKCCGQWADGITASGQPAKGYLVAADKSIPFGTLVSVPGYGPGPVPVLDRGGAITGNHIDLLFPTHKAALAWGRQNLIVTIYDKEQSRD